MRKRVMNFWRGSGAWIGAFVIAMVVAFLGDVEMGGLLGLAMALPTAMGQPESEHGDPAMGGSGVAGEGVQTLEQAMRDSPNLVTEHVHKELHKSRPYDYLLQSLISQNFRQKRKTKDHKVVVWETNSKPIKLELATAYTESGVDQAEIDFGADNKLVATNQTIIFPHIKGYKEDGATPSGHPLALYVVGIASDKKPIVKARNGKIVGGVMTIPSIAKGSMGLRGLRTGTETQIRTDPYNVLPTDTNHYIQKNGIEFQTTGWFDFASKKIKWDNRDLMEMAIDEKNRTSMVDFWFGVGGKAYFATKHNNDTEELAYFGEGLWTQAGREFDFNGTVDINTLIDFAGYIFKDNRSSNTKYFAMGSELSQKMQKVIFAHPVLLGETFTDGDLNINFTRVNFFGGKVIYFGDDPSMDDVGLTDAGFVLDHRYAFEYNYGTEIVQIDGKKLAQSDTKGTSITEERSFILTNREAHCRVRG